MIKVPFNGEIYDVYRDGSWFSQGPYDIKNNTGFMYVAEKGLSYTCNDIPKFAKKGKYSNFRLIQNKLEEYTIKVENSNGNEEDLEWMQCWKPYRGEELTSKTCYKSTMIIPIAVRDFESTMNSRKNSNVTNSDERKIYGFLCFDHRHTNFFRKIDEDIGYILADLLSLFMANRVMYLANSEVAQQAINIINSNKTEEGA